MWLVATGAEERLYTGSPDHLGARALAPTVPRRRLRYALSLDEVGTAAGLARARLDWQRDSGTGNSDHRELELAGRRAVKLGGVDNPCRHEPCDTPDRLRKGAFRAVLRLLGAVL